MSYRLVRSVSVAFASLYKRILHGKWSYKPAQKYFLTARINLSCPSPKARLHLISTYFSKRVRISHFHQTGVLYTRVVFSALSFDSDIGTSFPGIFPVRPTPFWSWVTTRASGGIVRAERNSKFSGPKVWARQGEFILLFVCTKDTTRCDFLWKIEEENFFLYPASFSNGQGNEVCFHPFLAH